MVSWQMHPSGNYKAALSRFGFESLVRGIGSIQKF